MDHKKIITLLKHFGCEVTDLNTTGSSIKMHHKTTKIQGITTDQNLPKLLRCSNEITYVVGNARQVTAVLSQFCDAMVRDMNYPVIYDRSQNAIVNGS